MRMVSRSWQNYLEGPQNCPQGWGFCLFLPRGGNFAKIFCPGAGNLTTLKNSPGVSPGRGGCWCLELTDASLLDNSNVGYLKIVMTLVYD